MLFANGQRVTWDSQIGTTEYGTILDLLLKEKNPHLKDDSYLLEMDSSTMIIAVSVKQNNLKAHYEIVGPLGDSRYWWRVRIHDGRKEIVTSGCPAVTEPQTEEQARQIADHNILAGHRVIELIRPDVDHLVPPDKPHVKSTRAFAATVNNDGLTYRQRCGLRRTRS